MITITAMIITVLIPITNIWNEPGCESVDDRQEKCIYTWWNYIQI